jgi:hypothetical protein
MQEPGSTRVCFSPIPGKYLLSAVWGMNECKCSCQWKGLALSVIYGNVNKVVMFTKGNIDSHNLEGGSEAMTRCMLRFDEIGDWL